MGGACVAAIHAGHRLGRRAQHASALPRDVVRVTLCEQLQSSLEAADRRAWVSPGNFGLDQGIVVMMIENHRSGLIWRLMRDCAPIRAGLRRAGFRGGWL